MHAEILDQEGYTSTSVDESPVRELFPGIRLRPLWKGPTGAHANVLEMDPGTSWPRRDVPEPGPEEVYVVAGTFNDGARDYPAGTFLHAPAGSWHVPATTTGCTLFLFCPEGQGIRSPGLRARQGAQRPTKATTSSSAGS
ncbi:cupin domain-containing protein [Actinopolymorpha singaporensis]|uniref:ChrR Cupin-like domain-containing protein n=1 Tax=Actinopolymorpha singaporensis TaxID=117157 RepID=A0A1H1RQX2_9ACTN|nr:cupin domain-containing protein [Actinopolymorpha singaporensis]SDS38100.1 ChrR Cupin-like domain-containing protein [Actinopolymorpha singaporensis]